jgi:hypothetical protein
MAWSSGGAWQSWRLSPATPSDIVRGIAPSPVEEPQRSSSKLLVSLSYPSHGRFLWRSWWAWRLSSISHRITESWSTQWGLACQQAHEPRDKSLSPCVDWDFIVTTTFECVGISLRVFLSPLHVGISSLHPTLYIWTLYSCVVVACVVVVVEVASLFT